MMKSYDNCLFAQPASIWYVLWVCVFIWETHKNNLRESEEKRLQQLLFFYDTAQIICVSVYVYICTYFYVQAKVIKTPVENNWVPFLLLWSSANFFFFVSVCYCVFLCVCVCECLILILITIRFDKRGLLLFEHTTYKSFWT